MGLAMRKARESDLPRLLEIDKRCFVRGSRGAAAIREGFKYRQDLVVRMRDGQIVAFILWSWSPNSYGPRYSSASVHLVATDPAERRRGHARALLKRCIDRCSQSHDDIYLVSRASNETAHTLYDAHGFKRVSRLRGPSSQKVYPDGERALHFRRSLSSPSKPRRSK